nr:MAG TPA: hypothetical protein [Caudoviricetes sp.]
MYLNIIYLSHCKKLGWTFAQPTSYYACSGSSVGRSCP